MSFKSAVITFPGSNCDRDALTYLKDLTHGEVFNIWHEESSLPNVDLVILPGVLALEIIYAQEQWPQKAISFMML